MMADGLDKGWKRRWKNKDLLARAEKFLDRWFAVHKERYHLIEIGEVIEP
jgi:hypothetical protein